MEPVEQAIREHLNGYLSGSLTLNEFQDWFIAATWNIESTAPTTAVELARDIGLVLAEATSGYLTRDELRSDLARLAHYPPAKTAISA